MQRGFRREKSNTFRSIFAGNTAGGFQDGRVFRTSEAEYFISLFLQVIRLVDFMMKALD